MFGTVKIGTRSINEYVSIVGQEVVDSLRAQAAPLRGMRVLHLTSPAASLAVRLMLQSIVPLFNALGINAQWQQVRMSVEHRALDQDLRRALSGYPVNWTNQHAAEWLAFNQHNAQFFDEEFDVVMVHHTGSVGLYQALHQLRGKLPPGTWLWHSHRNYGAAVPEAWALIRQAASEFSSSIYDYKEFIRPDAPSKRNVVISPGVDPLSPRARPVSKEVREAVLGPRGINVDQPILGQVVFSMREEDPMRVLDVYELVKAYKPEVQLIIVNLLPGEEVEGHRILEEMHDRSEKLGGIVVLTERDRIGNVELSALREESTVLLHQGLPRGVSIELLEEMWQSRPIVSSHSPVGIATLKDGKTGVLADTPLEQAEAILRLLDNPKLAARLGRAAHAEVARRYLVTHQVAGYLKLLQRTTARKPAMATGPRSR